MHRGRVRLERLVRARHRDAALADGVHLLGPGVDQRDVVTGARQKRSEVAADCSCSDEQYLLGHTPSWFVTTPALSRFRRRRCRSKNLEVAVEPPTRSEEHTSELQS